MNKGRNPKFEDLRQKAEELLGNKPSHLPVNPSEADSLKLIHELEVHQIEMEVLNDELMLAKEKAEVAAKRNLELFDFAPAGYFSLHPDGSIIELNLSAARMLGKKRSQLKNSRLGFFVSDDTKPIFNNFLEKTFNSNATKECEVTLSLSAESPKVVTLTGIVADKGDQCIVNMVDITQRKQAEKEKQISDALIRTLSLAIEQSPVTTVITDLAGNIEFVNPKFTEITGYTAEEVIGKNSRVLKSGDKPDSKYQELWDTILSGQSWHGIFQNKKKSGELYWESAVISPVKDEKGVITHFLAVKEDITERRQAEEEIKLKNEELHMLNAEKDKFFSIIAHDLRAPFNGFLGFTNMLVDDLDTLTLKETRKLAGIMKSSATNIFRLLENLLEWSRLKRGKIPFEPAPLLLMSAVSESMHTVIDSARKKEIEIRYEIPQDMEVFADEFMLGTILRNLATNAVKYTPRAGSVTIAAKPVSDSLVEISIKDTGIGMNPEMIDNLFKLDLNTSRKGTDGEPSTGLGLIICKEFIEKHGAKLWVESEEGIGSTFYFSLPICP